MKTRIPKRLAAALLSYVVLALIATFAFDGNLRLIMWLFFAFLAAKTLAVWRSQEEEEEE